MWGEHPGTDRVYASPQVFLLCIQGLSPPSTAGVPSSQAVDWYVDIWSLQECSSRADAGILALA